MFTISEVHASEVEVRVANVRIKGRKPVSSDVAKADKEGGGGGEIVGVPPQPEPPLALVGLRVHRLRVGCHLADEEGDHVVVVVGFVHGVVPAPDARIHGFEASLF